MPGSKDNMAVRRIVRRAAVAVPPIGRLYHYALDSARSANEQREQVERLTGELAAQRARAERLLNELAALAEERDSLELQLYLLRSDHQRATARNDELSATLHELRARMEAAGQTQRPLAAPTDLDLLCARIFERLTELFGEVAGELRQHRGGPRD